MEEDEKALTDLESRSETFLEARCLRRHRALSDELEAQASLAAAPSIAARAQLATFFHFSRVFLGETELCQRGITIGL